MSDIKDEIERLKMRKVELVHKLNLVEFMDEKEEYEKEIERIQRQIDILEKMN
ncbi:MAG: hypothetical protein HYW23_02905 [Candidatus Aenigmarchaeota archaeon]|nr:hypothetical protein [Candidatus Aenigmarchaeota archaeon]